MTSESREEGHRDDRGSALHARILAALFAISATAAAATQGDGAAGTGFTDAFANGRPILELRPRYNRIEESDKPLTTEGGTIRIIAGWRTAPWRDWRLTVEGIHADRLGPQRFNDEGGLIGSSPYPLLPDPQATDLNQAFVEYKGLPATRVVAGRQRVRIDNQRWVSDNDFRQIPQLFDGVGASYAGLANAELYAAHFTRARTTSGVDNALRLTLLHAAFNPSPGHALAAYGYFHDQPQNGAFTGFANNSYRVVGARAEGSFTLATREPEVPYIVEFAQQDSYAGGDPRIDAAYWRAGAGITWRDITLRADQEVKGSNAGLYGVQMPLTDFYAFNGWTLHFFNTPRSGLRDRWLTLRWPVGSFVLYGEAHRFRSDFGDLDYGRENDVGVSWSFMDGATLRLQHARYDPGSGGTGARVRKTWLTFTYSP